MLLWLVINTLLALTIGFALDLFWAHQVVAYAGWYIIFTTFCIFIFLLAKQRKEINWRLLAAKENRITLITITGATVFLFLHDPLQFKIIMDELVLLGTSMMMHFEKVVLVPGSANSYDGSFLLLDGYLDKRPYFHPFLISLIHDITGYRPENAFVLNVILCPILLSLTYLFAKKLAGKTAGIASVLLLVSIPLVSHNATGGHFEILNLVMILSAALLGWRYLDRPDKDSLSVFCYTGLLLTQTRYESALFILPIGLIVILGWWNKKSVILSWPVVFAPLLLITSPLQFRFFMSLPVFWQLDHNTEKTSPFSLSYISDNLDHAGQFFFQFGQFLANSPFVSIFGLVSITGFLFILLLRSRTGRKIKNGELITFLFLCGTLLSFSLTLCYHWGQLDDTTASRFSLPLYLMTVPIISYMGICHPKFLFSGSLILTGTLLVFFFTGLDGTPLVRMVFPAWGGLIVLTFFTIGVIRDRFSSNTVLLGVILFFICSYTIPVASNHRYHQRYTPASEMDLMITFFQEHPEKDYFFSSLSSLGAIVHEVSGAPIARLVKSPETVARHLKHSSYSGIFVLQLVDVDPDTGEVVVLEKFKLPPEFETRTITEKRVVKLQLARIVEIIAVNSLNSENEIESEGE